LLFLLLSIGLATAAQAEDRPAGVRISTWVREDIFAAFMGGDLTRF